MYHGFRKGIRVQKLAKVFECGLNECYCSSLPLRFPKKCHAWCKTDILPIPYLKEALEAGLKEELVQGVFMGQTVLPLEGEGNQEIPYKIQDQQEQEYGS